MIRFCISTVRYKDQKNTIAARDRVMNIINKLDPQATFDQGSYCTTLWANTNLKEEQLSNISEVEFVDKALLQLNS